jgi:hypothetical protein
MLRRHRTTALAAAIGILAIGAPAAHADAATAPPAPDAAAPALNTWVQAWDDGAAAARTGFQAGEAATIEGWQAGATATRSAWQDGAALLTPPPMSAFTPGAS